jgi:guanylate kinase
MTIAGWESPDRGALFVVSGASGSGKSTLLARLFATVPDLEFSVSLATRPPRAGERDGVDYHFVTPDRYAEILAAGGLLEHAEVYGTRYGTPRAPVEAALAAGRSMVLDIDTQGAAQVRASMPACVTIFVLPPSIEAIRARLVARGTDPPEVIARRVRESGEQLRHCADYDYVVMNRDLAAAEAQVVGIVVAELSRVERRKSWCDRVVGDLAGS